jgi:hypothetical protein
MKRIFAIVVAAVIASQPTVAMSATAAEWDCGNGAVASAYKGEFGAWISHPYDGRKEFPYSTRGSRHFDLTWDFRGSKDIVRLNGKLCKRTN